MSICICQLVHSNNIEILIDKMRFNELISTIYSIKKNLEEYDNYNCPELKLKTNLMLLKLDYLSFILEKSNNENFIIKLFEEILSKKYFDDRIYEEISLIILKSLIYFVFSEKYIKNRIKKYLLFS